MSRQTRVRSGRHFTGPHALVTTARVRHQFGPVPALRILFATFLRKQSGLKRIQAHTGAVTLIQRFGSAANLHVSHCARAVGGAESAEPAYRPQPTGEFQTDSRPIGSGLYFTG